MKYRVVSFYKLVILSDPKLWVKKHKQFFSDRSMTGRIYLATQGINAQLSGLPADVADYLDWIQQASPFADIDLKIQPHHENAFPRMTVKVRPELVALGQKVDLSQRGTHVSPAQWREMLESRKSFIKLDVRNDYEWDIGHFEGFERPSCESFRDFTTQAEELREKHDPKTTPVMMCCTGGIRCEFYSALLREKGFEQVYQLEGGMLAYAEQEQGRHWKGKLFVFDDRLAVGMNSCEIIGRCHACAAPSERHYNCANMDCNALFLSCPDCLKEFAGCCNPSCQQGPRVRPYDEQCSGKPFRKWYHFFSHEERQGR